MVEGFGVAHFTQGHIYNSTLNGMENMFGWFGILILILWVGEKVYVDGLKPLLQKTKAATGFFSAKTGKLRDKH